MNSTRYISVFVLLLVVTAVSCFAQTWDATRDFGASNPNGAWSYGSGVMGTSFTLYAAYDTDCAQEGVQGFVCWSGELYEYDPMVGFNTTGGWLNWWTVVCPPNALLIHPAPNWQPADSIVRWTAPVTGTYTIAGFFEILDTDPTGVVGMVYRNGTQLYRGELLGPPAQHPNQPGGREDFYFTNLHLNAGDVVSFGVNSDSNFYYDSTGFNATITIAATACATCSH